MRLHNLEIFGFVGLAVALALFVLFANGPAGFMATLISAPPLFVGQHIRHKQQMAELDAKLRDGK